MLHQRACLPDVDLSEIPQDIKYSEREQERWRERGRQEERVRHRQGQTETEGKAETDRQTCTCQGSQKSQCFPHLGLFDTSLHFQSLIHEEEAKKDSEDGF